MAARKKLKERDAMDKKDVKELRKLKRMEKRARRLEREHMETAPVLGADTDEDEDRYQ